MRRATDLMGKRFGRLVVLQRCGSQGGNAAWECLCDCGKTVIVKSNNLMHGTSKSCGCLEREQKVDRFTTHGLSATRLYHIWAGMKRRCHGDYKNYGAKGIRVCDEWQTFEPFEAWAMEHGYADNLTIDRIDPSKNYEPANCQWLTRSENSKKAWTDRRTSLI